MDDQPGLQFALQAVVQRLPALEQLGQRLQVLPQVGPRRDLERAPGMPADTAPEADVILRQQQVVEPYRIAQVANEQAAVVRVVDAQVQDELLLQQPRLHRFDLVQVQFRHARIIAAPTRTACQQRQQGTEQEQAGGGGHGQLPT